MDYKGDLAEQLVELRQDYLRLKESGVTQQQMAETADVPESTISMWLSGYRPIVRIDVMSKLLKALPELRVLA